MRGLLRTSAGPEPLAFHFKAMIPSGCWLASTSPPQVTRSPAGGTLWEVVGSTWRKWGGL